MFKKKCLRCGRKITKEYDFCPYCGTDFRPEKRAKKEKDYGLLGEDDFSPILPEFSTAPFGLNKMFNSIFSELTKQIDTQMKEADREIKEDRKAVEKKGSGISISISTSTGKKPEIQIKTFGPGMQEVKEAKIEKSEITEEDAKKLSKLPKKEAEAKVRRMSNKIVYEIDMPGVKSLKDVVINKLENSTEIKAFSKDAAYFKLVPIKRPLVDYKLEDDKLILEFQA